MGIVNTRRRLIRGGEDQWFFPHFVDKGICSLSEWRAACEEVAGWVGEVLPDHLHRNPNRPPPPAWVQQVKKKPVKQEWRSPYGSIENPEPSKGSIRYVKGCRRRYIGNGSWIID